jgi:hypothetical protein
MTAGEQLMQAISRRLESSRAGDWRSVVQSLGMDPETFLRELVDEVLANLAADEQEAGE